MEENMSHGATSQDGLSAAYQGIMMTGLEDVLKYRPRDYYDDSESCESVPCVICC